MNRLRPAAGGQAHPPRVTIDVIAGKAGLHRVTVARILQGTYQGRPSTAERVLRLARELDYAPDLFAQAMTSRRLPIVLVSGAADPYTAAYLEYLTCELRGTGLSLMVDFDRAGFPVRRRQLSPTASLVFADARSPGLQEAYASDEVIALITGPHPELPTACSAVRVDFRSGFAEAGRRLLAWGHRRVLFLETGRAPGGDHDERHDALASTLAGIERLCIATASDAATALAGRFAADDAPTAIVCPSDGIAFACLSALSQRGLRVPADVSLIGCDGLAFGGERAPLTSVRVPHRRVAQEVTAIITDAILPAQRRGEGATPRRQTIVCGIEDGGTAGPAPGGAGRRR